MNAPNIVPDITFDETLSLDVGDTRFELFHTPGETPDHLTVWVSKLKAVFLGDNFYESFPNMYTLRGTRPRWPLEYISALEKVMSLEPEIMVPSHGPAVVGKAEIQRQRAVRSALDGVLEQLEGRELGIAQHRESRLRFLPKHRRALLQVCRGDRPGAGARRAVER